MVFSHDTPELADLDLLASVAELGSLGRAAQRHLVSQPAVSMRMTQLEQRLGLRLLERAPSGTRLTVDGEKMLAAGRRVLAEAAALMATVETLRAQRRSHLRLAASFTIADQLVPGWLAQLDASPGYGSGGAGLGVTVEVSNSAGVLARVGEGSVDLGFVEGALAPPAGFASEELREDDLVVIVHPRHPWANRKTPVQARELARTPLIVRELGSGTREVLDAALSAWGGVRARLELGSTESIMSAARGGQGPAVVSVLAAADDLTTGRLARVTTEGVDLRRTLRAVWLANRGLPPLAQKFLRIASDRPPALPATHKRPRGVHKERTMGRGNTSGVMSPA